MINAQYKTLGSRIFDTFNLLFLGVLALTCILPVVHVFAVSFSDKAASLANLVTFWPIGFNTANYEQVFASDGFVRAFGVSITRAVLGTVINMLGIIITAYPLAREPEELKGRSIIIWILLVPMMFSGGLIPFFLLIRDIHLYGNFWVLILPGAIPLWSAIMMMNFFRGLPKGLYESAMIDGAGHFTILFKIFVPLSMASVATLSLFAVVGHWNEWFSGMVFLNNRKMWPLQTYLRQLVINIDVKNINVDNMKLLALVSDRSFRCAQIFIATLPILCVYPFLQKHFVKGIVLGSVKE